MSGRRRTKIAEKYVSAERVHETSTDIATVDSAEFEDRKLQLITQSPVSETPTQSGQSCRAYENREPTRIPGPTETGLPRKGHRRDSQKLTSFEEPKAEPSVRPRQKIYLRKNVLEPLQSVKSRIQDENRRTSHNLTHADTGSPRREHLKDSDKVTSFEESAAFSVHWPRQRISPRKFILEPIQGEQSRVRDDNPELTRCLEFSRTGSPQKEHGRRDSSKLTSLEKPKAEPAARHDQQKTDQRSHPDQKSDEAVSTHLLPPRSHARLIIQNKLSQKLSELRSTERNVSGNLTAVERQNQPQSRREILEEQNKDLNLELGERRSEIGRMKEHEYDLQRTIDIQEERRRLIAIECDDLTKRVSDLERQLNRHKNNKDFQTYRKK